MDTMAALKKHFSHRHGLTLVVDTENHPYRRCYGCTLKITKGVRYYRCEGEEEHEDCRFFFLHQACADMPLMTKDTLRHDPNCAGNVELRKYIRPDQSNHVCVFCHKSCYRFAYACSECTYQQCLACALRKNTEFNFSFHQHPVHWTSNASGRLCSVCSLNIPKWTGERDACFGCCSCDFVVHPHCTNVPLVVQAPSHPDHPLHITRFTESVSCRICIQVIDHTKELAYACKKCPYITHVYDYSSTTRYKEFKRDIIHGHPLLLVEVEAAFDSPTASEDHHSTTKECSGCRQIISWGPYYTCPFCTQYYLHKLCAEIPEQIEHRMHPGCILQLYRRIKSPPPVKWRCGACNVECDGFAYYCSSCKSVLDIVCALKEIKYCDKEFHPQHPLVLSHAKPPFKCHACDKEHEDISYQCNTCRFWVHESCSLLATMKEASSQDHEHDLHLIYSIPAEMFSDVDVYCQICTKQMKHHNWAYYCYRCRYFTHAYDCSNRNRDEVTIDPTVKVVDLPLPGELIIDNKVIKGETMKHHRNPMMLFPDQVSESMINQAIFNLMRSPRTWTTYVIDEKNYNGSTFTFYHGKLVVHFTSVDLPHYIKHEAHPHVLQSTFLNTMTWCNACEHSFIGYGYSCTACAFTIHTYCALLPGKIKHGYDKHPFPLTYSAIEGIEEYVCEICEKDVVPKWFYHCEDCDQSIHARCAWKAYNKFKGFFTFHLHECNLTVVPPSNDLPNCIICGTQETLGHGFAYACTEHDFMVHLTCTFSDEVKGFRFYEDESEVTSDRDLSDDEVEVSQNDEDLSSD